MKIQRAAVVGAGTMGAGIAQVLSQAGIEVVLKDVKQEFVESGLSKIKRMYESRVKKETLTQSQADELFGKISGTTTFDQFADVDLVIEAALETIEVKLGIFKELDRVCPKHAILASNTSALSISAIAEATKRQDKVLGMHFFNPAQFMKLVEVIPGLKTSKETTDEVIALCQKLKKIPVRVEECPGFLVNRLLFPYLNEALYALQEGIATVEQIDQAMVELGMPMGPFTLLDMTGLDVCAHVNNFLYGQYGLRFAPAKLLDLMVAHGFLGQKSGAGFYLHGKGQPAKDAVKEINPELKSLIAEANKVNAKPAAGRPFDGIRLLLPMFNEAIYALQEKVVAVEDVDVAMQAGCGMNKGLLSLAEEHGFAWCQDKLNYYEQAYGERFRPAWLLNKLVAANVHDYKALTKTPAYVR
jgi:3-hydroxyacyl-CoA dehydrogenase